MCIYDECVYGCIKDENGKRYKECHPHQNHVLYKLKWCSNAVADAFKNQDISKYKDFEELYAAVKSICRNYGLRQICTYDTALRISCSHEKLDSGRYGHLKPEKFVYLHCGALKGARALWKIDTLLRLYKKKRPLKPLNRKKANCDDFPQPDKEGNLTVPIEFFCKELRALGASALEDFLCVFHLILEGYYLRVASSLL